MRLRFTIRADADIEEITAFIELDNPQKAGFFAVELRRKCKKILRFPKASPLCSEFGKNIRVTVFGNYLILYIVRSRYVDIVRVVHGKRDVMNMLKRQH